MRVNEKLPIAVVGAGPVGLAAASNLVERGVPFEVFEAGETVGTSVRDWGHVRVFTTWEQSVDPASRRLLEAAGWSLPQSNALPTGEDLYRNYLKPLSDLPGFKGRIHTGTRVTGITRQGIDKVASKGRAEHPFEIRLVARDGQEHRFRSIRIRRRRTRLYPEPLGLSRP